MVVVVVTVVMLLLLLLLVLAALLALAVLAAARPARAVAALFVAAVTALAWQRRRGGLPLGRDRLLQDRRGGLRGAAAAGLGAHLTHLSNSNRDDVNTP